MLKIQRMVRQKIDSKDNPRLKLARRTREGKDGDRVFVEGMRLAEDALLSEFAIEFALVREGFEINERAARLIGNIEAKGIDLLEVGGRNFDSVAETRSPQGIILICGRPKTPFPAFQERALANESGINVIVVLDRINNPANLGAVLRTAEAAGITSVVTTLGSADVFSPAAIRASMGSAFRLGVWEKAELEQVISWGEDNDLRITSAAGNAPAHYTQIDWRLPRILIFGSEAHGLEKSVLDKSADVISIPMASEVESLNIAVAAGIILFEARRQASADGSLR